MNASKRRCSLKDWDSARVMKMEIKLQNQSLNFDSYFPSLKKEN